MSTSTNRDEPHLERPQLLRRVADLVPTANGEDFVRVDIDGVDGSGKTVFAGELANALQIMGRRVVRISVDDFHHVSAVRYRRGRSSPEGFWLDSFNYERLRADVLEPLGPGGSRRYRWSAHDLASDLVLNPTHTVAPAGAVLVVDGLFLHREELAGPWDFSVFLDVPFEVTAKRMAMRDGTIPDPQDASMRRYVEAQQLYIRDVHPTPASQRRHRQRRARCPPPGPSSLAPNTATTTATLRLFTRPPLADCGSWRTFASPDHALGPRVGNT